MKWPARDGPKCRLNPASTSRAAMYSSAASRVTRFIPLFLEHVGEDAMLFASDYLHFDALFVGEIGHDGKPYPGTVGTLMERGDVPDSAKRKMLLDNSIKFYGFDQKNLGRIGDTVARQETQKDRNAVLAGTVSYRSN